ncbi:unnamed protein product [Scytosiphon promiscuus]
MEESEVPRGRVDDQVIFPAETPVNVNEETGEGRVLEVRHVPLIPPNTPHIVEVVEVPPNVVFPEPPKPAAWLAPPASAAPPPAASTLPLWSSSLLAPYASLAGGTVAVAAAAAGLVLLKRARRRSFERGLARFSAAIERVLGDDQPSTMTGGRRGSGSSGSSGSILRGLGPSSGSLRTRVEEAERQVAVLETLIAEGLELGRRFPAEATCRQGQSGRRFQAAALSLSRRLARVERARKELVVMDETEQLLARLDSCSSTAAAPAAASAAGRDSGGVLSERDASAGEDGHGMLEDGDSEGDSDSDSSEGDEGRHGSGETARRRRRRGARRRPRAVARLATRASLLLSNRCVFWEELRRWRGRLAEIEQEAVDQLRKGLEKWDLVAIDRALLQLRLLGLPKIVEEFQGKREDVRGKRWRLREELKEAQSPTGRGSIDLSRLRKTCVKAELFSSDDLDEYRSAKRFLERAHAAELEAKARRILDTHGVPVDLQCNVRMDERSGPRILLRGIPDDPGRICGGGGGGYGYGYRALLDEGPGDAPPFGASRRRLDLHPGGEGTGEFRTSGASGRGFGREGHGNGSGVCNGYASSEWQASGGGGLGGEGTIWDQPPARTRADGASATAAAAAAVGGWETRLSQRQVQQLMTVRRNVVTDFEAYVTKVEDDRRLERERNRETLEARDAKDAHRQEYIARLDARDAREDERLAMEKERLLEENRRDRKEEAERRRREDAARLRELWAADGAFFRLLSLTDLAVAAAAAAFQKGFSLAPGTILEAAWGLVVAECTDGGGGVPSGGGGGGSGGGLGNHGTAPPVGTSPSSWAGITSSFSAAGGAAGAAAAASMTAEGGAAFPGGCGAGHEGCAAEAESALEWVWSSAGSAAGAVVRAGYSSAGWLLGQTLGLVTPSVQCEVRAFLSLGGWLLSLILALKVVGGLLGPGGGGGGIRGAGGGVAAQWVLVAAWVWGRFRDWVVLASRELVLFVAPTAVLVLAYGAGLRYVESHRRPDGRWWVQGWDVRALWSRALPAVVSGALACLLGAQVA